MPLDDRAIAISATFTAEALQPGLAFWAGELGLDYEIRFAGYNQLFQELLDPAGLFARNQGGINVALVRFEDWRQAGISAEARRLVDAIRGSAAAFTSPLLIVICPPTSGDAEQIVREGVADLPSVYVIAPAEVASRYAVDEIYDLHAEELGHLPYTPEFFVALATAIARRIHGIGSAPYKVA